MKERGILFQPEKVRWILGWDFETQGDMQTRRLRGLDDVPAAVDTIRCECVKNKSLWCGYGDLGMQNGCRGLLWQGRCPYGEPGDRLYVKQRWGVHKNAGTEDWREVGPHLLCCDDADGTVYPVDRWRSSRFMPKKAATLWLEVTDVRPPERVQEISEDDAKAEGVQPLQMDHGRFVPSFQGLWDSINAKRGYGWNANPWVWAISFRRLT